MNIPKGKETGDLIHNEKVTKPLSLEDKIVMTTVKAQKLVMSFKGLGSLLLTTKNEEIERLHNNIIETIIARGSIVDAKSLSDKYCTAVERYLESNEQKENMEGQIVMTFIKGVIYLLQNKFHAYNDAVNAAIDYAYNSYNEDLYNHITACAEQLENYYFPEEGNE